MSNADLFRVCFPCSNCSKVTWHIRRLALNQDTPIDVVLRGDSTAPPHASRSSPDRDLLQMLLTRTILPCLVVGLAFGPTLAADQQRSDATTGLAHGARRGRGGRRTKSAASSPQCAGTPPPGIRARRSAAECLFRHGFADRAWAIHFPAVCRGVHDRATRSAAHGPGVEIGTGSGYQAAVLSGLVKDVYTIEIQAPLGERAAATLRRLGYENVHARVGDGYQGWVDAAHRQDHRHLLTRKSAAAVGRPVARRGAATRARGRAIPADALSIQES